MAGCYAIPYGFYFRSSRRQGIPCLQGFCPLGKIHAAVLKRRTVISCDCDRPHNTSPYRVADIGRHALSPSGTIRENCVRIHTDAEQLSSYYVLYVRQRTNIDDVSRALAGLLYNNSHSVPLSTSSFQITLHICAKSKIIKNDSENTIISQMSVHDFPN